MTDSRRWAPLLWFEPHAADRVSTLWVQLVGWYQSIILHSLYNGQGRHWRKYGHYFGGKWSLLFRGQSSWPSLSWSGGTHPFASRGFKDCRALFLPITAAADFTDWTSCSAWNWNQQHVAQKPLQTVTSDRVEKKQQENRLWISVPFHL